MCQNHYVLFLRVHLTDEDGFGARIIQMLGDNSADAYVFNGGVPDSSTWRTADGLNFISRMTEGEVSAEVNCAPDLGQLMQPDSIDIVPG